MILDIYENLKYNSMKDLGYLKEVLPSLNLAEGFKSILSNFNYFGNCEVFKDSLNLGYYAKESLPNQNLDEDCNSFLDFSSFPNYENYNDSLNHNEIIMILENYILLVFKIDSRNL